MTRKEINKIAEEYVNNPYPNGLDKIIDIELFLEWLNARYYLVNKGKVEHEMIKANQNINIYKNYIKVRYANEVVKRVLTKLFGLDIRKEEEE